MAKLEEKKIVTKTIKITGLDRGVSEDTDIQKSIGRAAHYLLHEYDWIEGNVGEEFVRSILRDLKKAMGVRAPSKTRAESAAEEAAATGETPKPKKRRSRKKKKAATPAEKTNGDADPGTAGATEGSTEGDGEDASPQDGADASTEESSSQEGTGDDQSGAAAEPGAKLSDPFQDT